ncbi:MAG: hypothetical protein ABH872_07935 [Candidatus Omnitrophota bacterium]
MKLAKNEKAIENALLQGEYVDIDKKDSVLNIRMNGEDLKLLRKKAQRFGVRYQTFISELLHRIAHS